MCLGICDDWFRILHLLVGYPLLRVSPLVKVSYFERSVFVSKLEKNSRTLQGSTSGFVVWQTFLKIENALQQRQLLNANFFVDRISGGGCRV
jgi:hypothetical protein